MGAEQVVELGDSAGAPEVLPPTTGQRAVEFFGSAPLTLGVYQGAGLEGPDGVHITPGNDLPSPEAIQLRSLDLRPAEQLGAGDSQHGVVFGDLTATVDGDAWRHPVAIKPFKLEPEKAAHEHDALLQAQARGFETFQPLALAKDGDTAYLVTQYRDDVMTFDNIDWSISPNNAAYAADVTPHLHFIADAMAAMHAQGIFHNDAQPKNFATTDTSKPMVMDLEDATIAANEAEQVALMNGPGDVRDSKIYGDVAQFWYVLTHPDPTRTDNPPTFLEGESYETCMEQFRVNFLPQYLSALARHAAPAIYNQLNIDELQSAIVGRIARTT